MLAFPAKACFMNKDSNSPHGWYSRGYLPHFDGGAICQFVTFRLYDSMPQNVLERWRQELLHDSYMDAVFRKRVEGYLDQGYGNCFLKEERIALMVQDAMLFFDGKRYKLIAWVIMPNHVHALLTPINEFKLEKIMHSWKSFTSKEANKILNRKGHFWFREYFDRYIRDTVHYERVVAYIENNPVKAHLCEKTTDWKFSSAWFRNVIGLN